MIFLPLKTRKSLKTDEGGDKGHILIINKNNVIIETLFREPKQKCTIEASEFWEAYEQWMTFVKEYFKTNQSS